MISFGKLCGQCGGFILFFLSLSYLLTSQVGVVALFGVPVNATCLLATVIPMMAGATTIDF